MDSQTANRMTFSLSLNKLRCSVTFQLSRHCSVVIFSVLTKNVAISQGHGKVIYKINHRFFWMCHLYSDHCSCSQTVVIVAWTSDQINYNCWCLMLLSESLNTLFCFGKILSDLCCRCQSPVVIWFLWWEVFDTMTSCAKRRRIKRFA